MMKRLLLIMGLALCATLGMAQPAKAVAKTPAAKPAAKMTLACMDCHGSVPKTPILGARLGYDESMHKKGGNARYANGGGCQKCHTNEGFIEFAMTGKVDDKGFVAYPSQPGCFTCHAPHETGDMSVRPVKAVLLANGAPFKGGKGDLCAVCHQSRVDATKTVASATAKTLNANWGAHHGPMADLVAGTNGYEFPGKTYASSVHKMVVQDSCVACHLTQPSARYSFSPKVGGHSFNVVGEVHEEEKGNTAGCIACHKDLKLVPGSAIFNLPAKADYDQDGKLEPSQEEVKGLLDKFVNKDGSGYLQKMKVPLYKPDGTWKQPPADAALTAAELGALYNYKMVLEDKSLGVHNTRYAVELLYDSLQALDPAFNVTARP